MDLMSVDGSPSIIGKSVFIPTEVKNNGTEKGRTEEGSKNPSTC